LGVENLDLDVVVEGDGIFFAEKLASALDGRVRSHHQFGTAIVFLPDGQKIDVASARAEFYARPAAMPEVASSSIKQDLYRRDFTVNAMALKLNSQDFGRLVDFFGGLRDLQHGVIRVLHNLSFIEDPTRAFRAVRFEQRHHFRMEGHTESLLKQAIHGNIFEKVAFERIRDEMILILSEEYPLPALQRLHKLKLLRVIHPDLKLDQRQIEILEGVQKAGKEYEGLLKKYSLKLWLLYCIALLASLARESAEQVCHRFRFSKTIMKRLSTPEEGVRKMISALSAKDMTAGGLADRLQDFSDEVVFFILSQVRNPRVKGNLEEYMTTLRKLRGYLTGKDLKAMGVQPGPVYRQLLHKALLAQLDGEIIGHEEAIQFASRELARRGQG
ncbi:MAG: CCA tRNA nucleotidyltransferase, partial [Armatimonadetes bacterium]|nr:CCA tRNA nucleotidyltransferase [Armatimonadota bacterium]